MVIDILQYLEVFVMKQRYCLGSFYVILSISVIYDVFG